MARQRIDQLLAAFRTRPSAPAVTFEGQTWSYQTLEAWSDRYARVLLSHGVQPGDRIVALCRPSAHLIAAMLAVFRLGAIWVPIHPQYPAPEVAHVVSDSRPTLLWFESELADALPPQAPALTFAEPPSLDQPPLPWTATDDLVALMIYTSGTTGRSKGVQLSYRALVNGLGSLTTHWQWSSDDVLCLMLPLFHVHGLGIGVLGGLIHGLHIRLHGHFDPAIIVDDVAHHGATIFMGVPTMYARLLAHLEADPSAGPKLRPARLFTSGSAALPAEHVHAFERATTHRILERYGMSETLLTLSNPYDGERRPGAVGFPIPGVEIRIVDDDGHDLPPHEPGELWVRTVGMMEGYWERPDADAEAFTPDGWFRTGDVVTRDEDGYVHIVGRRSVDIIKSGGFKIGAREIEDLLRTHPAVAEIAVFGQPDPQWGEQVTAAIVLQNNTTIDPDTLLTELQALCTQHLAHYKKVRTLVLLDELPRNAMGKVQKTRLRSSE